jgi:integrase
LLLQVWLQCKELGMASIHRDTRRGTWLIRRQITADGRVYKLNRTLPPQSTKEQIHQAAADLDRQASLIAQGKFLAATPIRLALVRWQTAAARFTARTQSEYTIALEEFAASLPPFVRAVADIKAADIEDYLQARLALGNKARTANIRLTAIKSFFRWASEHYELENPAASIPLLAEDPPVQRFLSPAEYAVLLNHTAGHIRRRIEFLANTGLRATEFCSLRWSQVSPDRRSISIIGKRQRLPIQVRIHCKHNYNRSCEYGEVIVVGSLRSTVKNTPPLPVGQE